jgi:hypothetical protein
LRYPPWLHTTAPQKDPSLSPEENQEIREATGKAPRILFSVDYGKLQHRESGEDGDILVQPWTI